MTSTADMDIQTPLIPSSSSAGISKFKGLLLILISGPLLAANDIGKHYFVSIPTGQYIALIGSLVIFTSLPFFFIFDISLIPSSDRKYLILRCITALGCIYMRTWAVKHMPYGDAIALTRTSPFFTILTEWVVFRVVPSCYESSAAIIGLIGVLFISKPSFLFASVGINHTNWIAPLIALFSEVLESFSTVLQRKLSADSTVHPAVSMFYLELTLAVLGIPMGLALGDHTVIPGCGLLRVVLSAIAVANLMGMLCFYFGLRIETAGTAATVRLSDILIAYVCQYWWFDEGVDWLSMVGMSCIVMSTVVVIVARAKKNTSAHS